MGLTGLQAYALSQKGIKACASGYDHATRTGDNTFSVFFQNGDKVDLTIATPADGVSITDVDIDADSHLICTMSDGSTIDAGELPDGGGKLKAELKATQAIGSVTAGKTYAVGTELETIIRDMLIKEEAPAVTLTLNPVKALYDVVTETLSTIVLTAAVTQKTYPPTSVKYYVDDVLVETKEITAGGTFSYTHTFNPATAEDHTFKVVATDGTLSGNASKTIKFVAKSYYGVIASDIGTPSEAQIKGLANNTLKDVKGLTFDGITTDFGKVSYAYPASMGALASIKDPVNNYNYTDSFSKATVSVDGIDYFVYTQTEPSAADNVKLVFA